MLNRSEIFSLDSLTWAWIFQSLKCPYCWTMKIILFDILIIFPFITWSPVYYNLEQQPMKPVYQPLHVINQDLFIEHRLITGLWLLLQQWFTRSMSGSLSSFFHIDMGSIHQTKSSMYDSCRVVSDGHKTFRNHAIRNTKVPYENKVKNQLQDTVTGG